MQIVAYGGVNASCKSRVDRQYKCVKQTSRICYIAIDSAEQNNNNYSDNGEGPYDWLYNNYEYIDFKVKIQYGFRLDSGDETIPGGIFIANSVAKDEDIIVIECISDFENKSGNALIKPMYDADNFVMFELSGKSQDVVKYGEMSGQTDQMTGEEVFKEIGKDGIECVFNDTISDLKTNIVPDSEYTIANAIHYFANISLQKCIVSRDGKVVFSEYGEHPEVILKALNMMEKPSYSRSSSVKDVHVKTLERNETITEAGVNYRHGITDTDTLESLGYASGKELFYRNYAVDFADYEINEVTGKVIKIKRAMIPKYTSAELDLGGGATASVVVYTGEMVRGIEVWTETKDLPRISLRKRFVDSEQSKQYQTIGETCDIDNPCGIPISLDKIYAYYANRDIYDISMRGDPSIDVGDYVWIEINNSMQKALLLESELEFNGSFKDNVKVRIINTDFEKFIGSTHEHLSQYTHDFISNYTHEQLNTEVEI